MEKVIYPLWKSETLSIQALGETLLNGQLWESPNVRDIKLCIVDEDVAGAAGYRMKSLLTPAPDAILILWVESASRMSATENQLAHCTSGFHGYLVTESDQLPDYTRSVTPGERTPGMNQVVFLQKPERLDRQSWLEIWLESHTAIAIETQSTFGYRQNVVARKLTPDAPDIDAIIEENFPEAAIHSRDAFYDAEGDPELHQQREKVMVDSCVRFIDFDKIDCIPTSEYPARRRD